MKKSDLSDDARDILDEIEDMSRCNTTDGTTRKVIVRPSTGETITVTLPWAAALRSLTASDRPGEDDDAIVLLVAADLLLVDDESPDVMDEHPRCSFVEAFSDGDRPADLTDDEYERLTYPGRSQRLETYDAIWRVLTMRCDAAYDPEKAIGGGFGTVVRLTHRAVHRALTDEDTRGCKWCAEDAR